MLNCLIRLIPTIKTSCLAKTIITMTFQFTMDSTPAWINTRNLTNYSNTRILTQPRLSRPTRKLHSRLKPTRMLKYLRVLLLSDLKGMGLLQNLWGAMTHRKLTSLFGAQTSKASLAKIRQRKCSLHPDTAYSKEPIRFKKFHVAILIQQFLLRMACSILSEVIRVAN